MKPFKIIIAGGRDFEDYTLLKSKLDNLLSRRIGSSVEIVSGAARGADKLGERYARENDLPVKLFPADWDTHGKAAGYIRNSEMADYADALVAFWDGNSKGTKHMIDLARAKDLRVRVFTY